MDDDVYIDPLFVGLTRPATVLGVPYLAFVVNFMVTTIVFLGVGNPLYMLIAVPTHLVLYGISSQDPGIFSPITQWMLTSSRCRNSKFWGAASFSPLRVKKWVKQ